MAVWGTGDFANRLLTTIKNHNPDLWRSIIGVLVKDRIENETFNDLPVLEISKIPDYSLSCIIIGSIKYEDEIYEEIENRVANSINVIRLGNLYLRELQDPELY